jgi:hypothetical protein
MSPRPLLPYPFLPVLAPSGPRAVAAVMLHGVSLLLGRLAQYLVAAPAAAEPEHGLPLLEFHADAGAPEGALYVDGQLVALLPGVNRL